MIRQLSSIEIDELLRKQLVGRIGCYFENEIYIVPISYAYEDNAIYCHSFEGRKIEMMRKNPKICFQIDEMQDMANWKSVIVWGDFEELIAKNERSKALKILLHRPLPIVSSITTHLGETWPFTSPTEEELDRIPGIVFRVFLTQKTGKLEATSESPLLMFS